MNKLYKQLLPYIEKSTAFNMALTLFDWDNATEAPKEAIDNTSAAIGVLSDAYYASIINDEAARLYEALEKDHTLSPDERAIASVMKKEYDLTKPIPKEEYSDYTKLISTASGIWQQAKEGSDFEKFAPTLEKIIQYKKKFAGYIADAKGYDGPLYNILLDEYEEGFSIERLDTFFNKLKEAIVPLVKKVTAKNHKIDKSYNFKSYNIDTQKQLSRELAAHVGFDFSRGVLKESAHPFTTNLHNNDVRITTAYAEDNLESAMFSTIHESGHALYELHIDDKYTCTPAGTGTSMGMHEGQSRLFENNLGRSRAFWVPLFPKLKAYFPEQLKDVTLDQFILGINKCEPDLIRTEADELTYCLHIMVRYEIEKLIFDEDIDVRELPKLWNDKYKEYLGKCPQNDSEGILQDIHWSGGDFGYFPSYAIGTAIAAQIYAHLKSVMPLEDYLKEGNFEPINEYLKEHIHRFGKTKNTDELLKGMMGESFNPDYYIQYLTEKYEKLYS